LAQRIADEPAFVLHRYDWSESSLILEVFTRHHGRTALVAKGVKKPSSSFRPVLLPLQMLHLAFGGDGEIRTLKSAEWLGGQGMPTGEALMSGYYLNELVLRLLGRDDAHPRLFDAYAQAVEVLGSEHGEALEPALRAFELLALREAGVLPALDVQTATLAPLQPGAEYALLPEAGLVERSDPQRPSLNAEQWLGLQEALDDPAPFTAMLTRTAEVLPGLKLQLRALLHYHCGVGVLRTRQMMMDLQSL
jgi:DNA repair protein RecO (recombination protein O)